MKAPVETPRGRQSGRGLRRTQLSDEVAGRLRAEIMSGVLKPGTFIRLDETAAQLGVSITPVREALLTLRGEGMVRLEPHRGYTVVPMSRQDIEDIFWLQSTIARELATSATTRITDAGIDELEELNDALATAVAAADSEAVVAAEFAFHRAFNRVAGRIKLAWFLLHVARSMPALLYAADPGWGADAVGNHRDLIAALRARDAEAVATHTSWQFTDAANRLTAVLERSGMWR
ncbi:GntR family transcriptional regulator [Mycolicibacterium mengxianglii]|uniref:GntR family transcriptional regulator n=1 Tax=Mycolicibacterium mengxianglii TaxID=2736649 RepID=UPI001E4BBA35|nr:GntR family transcriptional regulator [Mycolicibacterium mengxianglii]